MSGARERFTDELRGFALLGIVLVNAQFLAISWTGTTQASIATGIDRAAAFAVVALAQAKFYLLFSFLFGYSLSFILRDDGAQARERYWRRLIGLAVLGVIHVATLFMGDILFFYALAGTVLVWLRRRSDRFVLGTAGLLYLGWAAAFVLFAYGVSLFAAPLPIWDARSRAIDLALASGTFMQAMGARLSAWPDVLVIVFTLNGPAVLAMFAVGLVAGRHKVLARAAEFRRLWQVGALIGLCVGLPLGVAAGWLSVGPGARLDAPSGREVWGLALSFVGAPFLSFGFVAALALLRIAKDDALAWLRAPGAMSLTVYLGESLLLSLIFCGYGLGPFGKLGSASVAAVAIGVWVVLGVFARAWFARFDRGPMEMLLGRCIGPTAPARRD